MYWIAYKKNYVFEQTTFYHAYAIKDKFEDTQGIWRVYNSQKPDTIMKITRGECPIIQCNKLTITSNFIFTLTLKSVTSPLLSLALWS